MSIGYNLLSHISFQIKKNNVFIMYIWFTIIAIFDFLYEEHILKTMENKIVVGLKLYFFYNINPTK